MAADRRKIQRLEEELAESETVRKKLERENKRLERDLKEAQETLDGKSAVSRLSMSVGCCSLTCDLVGYQEGRNESKDQCGGNRPQGE